MSRRARSSRTVLKKAVGGGNLDVADASIRRILAKSATLKGDRMMAFGSGVLSRAQVFCAAMIASCALLAPATLRAQTDKTIVMACANEYPGQQIYTFNMAAKTVLREVTIPNPGGNPDPVDQTTNGRIIRITDLEIIFDVGAGKYASRNTLNRYTGNISWQLLDAEFAALAATTHAATGASCRKQQKQL
jgi:hypothetical protein